MVPSFFVWLRLIKYVETVCNIRLKNDIESFDLKSTKLYWSKEGGSGNELMLYDSHMQQAIINFGGMKW